MQNAISIDIGENTMKAAVFGVKSETCKTVYKGPVQRRDIVGQISGIVDQHKGFDGIGVAAPGLLDANRGVIIRARNLGVENLKIVDMLEDRYNVPVFLSNDAVASVVGERFFGAGKKSKNIVYLTFSAGLECGIIENDRVLLGKDGNAHEIGHCTIDASSEVRCGCGKYGHWEAFSSGNGIPVFARHLLDTKFKGRKSKLHGMKTITAKDVFDYAKSGDAAAKGIVAEIGRINALGVANIVELYDPELITIGGAVALNNRSAVMGPIMSRVKGYTINRMPKITITPLGDMVTLYGAVADLLG